jgi:uncharacterized membrane protein/gas vesicle protein
MKKAVGLMAAAGIGAGAMYLFDPDRGKRRRGQLRSKARHFNKIAADVAGKTQRDLRNHLSGVVSHLETLFREEESTNEVREARVRSKLGRVVSHPHAIVVKAVDGVVKLSGPILAKEVQPLLNAIISVGGVKNIENDLAIHDEAGDIPALQGGRLREGERFGPFKTTWSPTTRLISGVAGSALAIYGGTRRSILGSVIGSVGLGLATRALTNVEAQQLVGIDANARGIAIDKTITINAPIDEVFTYWSHPENFPEFMSHVRSVTKIGDGLYRWKVGGPAGLLIEWDAAVTKLDFNKLLAWQSRPGSIVDQHGVSRFTANPDGSTRIDVKMRYNPPAGVLGHEIARLFGVDPKHELDDDLMRMKSFIETGIHPHDAWVGGALPHSPVV